MDKIYVVMREYGEVEYEYNKTFPVKAFKSGNKAETYADQAQCKADDLYYKYLARNGEFEDKNELDESCDITQDNTYFVKEIPFDDSEE